MTSGLPSGCAACDHSRKRGLRTRADRRACAARDPIRPGAGTGVEPASRSGIAGRDRRRVASTASSLNRKSGSGARRWNVDRAGRVVGPIPRARSQRSGHARTRRCRRCPRSSRRPGADPEQPLDRAPEVGRPQRAPVGVADARAGAGTCTSCPPSRGARQRDGEVGDEPQAGRAGAGLEGDERVVGEPCRAAAAGRSSGARGRSRSKRLRASTIRSVPPRCVGRGSGRRRPRRVASPAATARRLAADADRARDAVRARCRCASTRARVLIRHPHRAVGDRDARPGRCRPAIVAVTTFPSRGSTRETVASRLLATHTAPSADRQRRRARRRRRTVAQRLARRRVDLRDDAAS